MAEARGSSPLGSILLGKQDLGFAETSEPYNDVAFAYMATDEDIGVVTGIFPGLVQEPDAVYPPD
jgi:hypothetical protein